MFGLVSFPGPLKSNRRTAGTPAGGGGGDAA